MARGCTLPLGTPILTWGYPGKDLGPETWERTWDWDTSLLKGPGTRDLGKNLGQGHPPVDGHTPVKILPCRIPLEIRAVIKQPVQPVFN